MTSQAHLQMINLSPNKQHRESNFPLFPLLPKELRLKIWRQALQRQRLLNLTLKSRTRCSPQVVEASKPANKGERFCAFVDGHQVLSELVRVNKESREETLKVYRVHIPCLFTGRTAASGKKEGPGTLYFSPEHDYLHIHPEWSVKDTLLDFFYHLKHTYDSHHIGLLNMAIDINSLNANDLSIIQPSDLDPGVLAAFTNTLTQLRSVFFVSTPRVGRQIFGLMSGLLTSETLFNRSLPIIAKPPSFERLPRDPRPIAEDLRKVHTGMSDPRHVVQLWQQLLQKWQIVPPPEIDYRFLLAFDPTVGDAQDQIFDREGAESWLRKENENWINRVGDQVAEQEEVLVRPAFGFWLFPLAALGPMQEEGLPEELGFRHRTKPMLNFTEHWPELALIDLH